VVDIANIGKLIVYGELQLIDKAKAEYDRMFQEKLNPHFLETVKEYGEKYASAKTTANSALLQWWQKNKF
jgi:hypothetical protein